MFYLSLTLVLGGLLIFQPSCNKDDGPVNEPQYLSLGFPRLDYKHNLYYLLDDEARSIEIIFSETVDPGTVTSNISLSDKTGSLDSDYDFVISEKVVVLVFHQDFILKDGWKYDLILTTGLVSTSG